MLPNFHMINGEYHIHHLELLNKRISSCDGNEIICINGIIVSRQIDIVVFYCNTIQS